MINKNHLLLKNVYLLLGKYKCILGWVKCREQNFTVGYTLYNYVCKKKKKIQNRFFFFFYITDYGKMLKYREKYRSTDISVDL